MPRPHKCRNIGFVPDYYLFKPAGIPGSDLEEIVLLIDELEAMRLADFEEIYQDEAAKKMNVSRQTFGNIINSAHKKITDALLHGKMIKIEGGNVNLDSQRTFACGRCRHGWEVPFGEPKPNECPECNSEKIAREKGTSDRDKK